MGPAANTAAATVATWLRTASGRRRHSAAACATPAVPARAMAMRAVSGIAVTRATCTAATSTAVPVAHTSGTRAVKVRRPDWSAHSPATVRAADAAASATACP